MRDVSYEHTGSDNSDSVSGTDDWLACDWVVGIDCNCAVGVDCNRVAGIDCNWGDW